MKYNLPILAVALTLAFGGHSAVADGSRFAAQQPASAGNSISISSSQLLTQSAKTLFEAVALEADISQDVTLFGQTLTGVGKYRQLGQGRGRVWLSLNLVAKGKSVGRLEQMCTGETLYIRRETPVKTSQSYVRLDQVRNAIGASDNPREAEARLHWMAHGGLPNLLVQLNENFSFSAPQPDYLEAKSPGSSLTTTNSYRIPVWTLEGNWKPDVLKRLLSEEIPAGQSADWRDLPKHLPHKVEVTLGNDDKFPLFPYKITYLRIDDDQQSAHRSQTFRPIVALRFFMVRHRPDLGPQDFQYELAAQAHANPSAPGQDNTQWLDATASFIKNLGLTPAK